MREMQQREAMDDEVYISAPVPASGKACNHESAPAGTSSESHIQNHHQHKADRKGDGSGI